MKDGEVVSRDSSFDVNMVNNCRSWKSVCPKCHITTNVLPFSRDYSIGYFTFRILYVFFFLMATLNLEPSSVV